MSLAGFSWQYRCDSWCNLSEELVAEREDDLPEEVLPSSSVSKSRKRRKK